MVVRFPSEPHSGADAGNGEQVADAARASEHLAPVTPLRRGGASPERRPGRLAAAARPIAELPDAGQRASSSRAHPSRAHPSRGRSTDARPVHGEGSDEPSASSVVEQTERWNNTWANDPDRASELASQRVAEVEDEETERLTRKTAALTIRQLARRGMSRWELEQLLTKREIAPEVFAPELDRLEAMGVIDDASLAATLAFTQHSRKGLGRSAIELDLKRRHIAPELIEDALADIADEDELDRATELAVKRIGQLASYDDETARRRLHGFLARKGYDSSVVRQAMDAAFAARGRRGGVRFQ